MRLIGLCGRSGSGKSSFCKAAQQQGVIVIDCDAVYKELVSKPTPCLKEIEENFGSSVIKNDSLDRKTLANIVFTNREKLLLLNSITHKHIRASINEILENLTPDSTVILDAPTLFESGIDGICDHIVGIIASDEACIERIITRDGIPREKAVLRLSNQLSNDFIIEHSDTVIYNDSTKEALFEASTSVIALLKRG